MSPIHLSPSSLHLWKDGLQPYVSSSPLAFTPLAAFISAIVFSFWHGVNSDLDNVPQLVTQPSPAGHCTCKFSTNSNCSDNIYARQNVSQGSSKQSSWTLQYERDDQNLGLSKVQCLPSFSGLFEDINRAVNFWTTQNRLSTDMLDNLKIKNGMARARLHQGRLYVVEARAAQDDHRREILAVLSSIYRAFPTAPDINFVFSVEDRVERVMGWMS